MVFDFLNETLYEMDSMSQVQYESDGYGRELTRKFSTVLNGVYNKLFAIRVKDVYRQENGYDCGILALMNAQSFVNIVVNGKNFDQETIPFG